MTYLSLTHRDHAQQFLHLAGATVSDSRRLASLRLAASSMVAAWLAGEL